VRADRAYRDAIATAANGGASIRELAAFTGLAPNTIRKIIDGN
jgi:DNA-binding transcriptional regulator YhcF (GntR family)